MSNWQFDTDEVLSDSDGRWWHVVHRWRCADCGDRRYELADATHSEYQELHADDVEGAVTDALFESEGWETTTKPASVNGYRVNGVLCGPSQMENRRGLSCIHEYDCPDYGADGYCAIHVVRDYEDGTLRTTQLACRECGHEWSDE